MKASKFFSVTLVLTNLLLLSLVSITLLPLSGSTPLSLAQGPEPPATRQIQAQTGSAALSPLSTSFTYQGHLVDDGTPVDDTCDLQFSIYDDLTGGTLVAGPLDLLGISVSDGLFTVLLDFGGIFQGDAYWLEVAVQCGGDASYTTMDPRQGLTATPYALSLQPGAVISGTVSGSILTAFNQDYNGFGIVGLQVGYEADDLDSYWSPGGFFGGRNGVVGLSKETGGHGVIGYSDASSDSGYGVYGVSKSTSGRGVYGQNLATSGTTYGVYGQSASSQGYGVYGYASTSTGTTSGVYGRSNSYQGYGVYGYSTATNGNGVHGEANRYGVVGVANATTGPSSAILGNSASTSGNGVYGYASASSGTNYGVKGVTASAAGYGVYYTGGLGGTGLMSFVVETQDYGWRHLYGMGSSESRFEEFGTAQLVDGWATVTVDPIFAQAVNLNESYQVFLTPQGDCGLYVATKTAGSFTVQALDGKACTVAFDYRIVAKRLGYEDVHLSSAAAPPPPEEGLGGGE